MNPPELVIRAAIEMAKCSPCQKSKRGALVFRDLKVRGAGFNSPPRQFLCSGSDACRSDCSRICEHAEGMAIRTFDRSCATADCDLLHVKVVDGELVPSGEPSCWQCSRQIVMHGFRGIWLFHVGGWVYYEAWPFHLLTLQGQQIQYTLRSLGA